MLSAVGAAHAVPPLDLDSAHVTDVSDVLTDADEATANERLSAVFEATGIDLYVVYVEDFTDPADRIAWTNETADRNGLGASQYLLAVSTEGRQYFISALDSGPLSDNQIAGIEEQILPKLRDSDWLGTITTAADAVESADGAGGRTTAIVAGSVAGAVGIGGAAIGITRARKKKRAARELQERLEELERTAGAELVAADDAVKASEQELEFARAQFGDEVIVEFAAALTAVKPKLMEAFSIQQQLDDAFPETDAQKEEMLQGIIERCASVDETLEAQADSFTELRAIERNPAPALAEVQRRHGAAAEDATRVDVEFARLQAAYAADELQPVAENPTQAASLLTFASERAQAAHEAVQAASSGVAAVAIHEAESAVSQAESLQKSVFSHGEELLRSEDRSRELITELESDIATARSVPDPDGRVAAAANATAEQVAEARADLTGTDRRPARSLQALEAANTNIDGVVQSARDAERARQLLDAKLAQARDQVGQVEQYIASRRGAIGASARTRASEARAALSRAEASSSADPQAALTDTQRASQLASQALTSAQYDVNGYGSGGYGGSGYSSGGQSDLGALLSGILIGSSSGGRSGGGFGGWSGGGSRSRSGSSWSGGASRSRSGGGSRRSSGGSRRSSGGGRF